MVNRVMGLVGVLSVLATSVQGSQINVTGDLGPLSVTGTTYSPINTFTTTNFVLSVPGFGLLVGDVFANNTAGASFALRITNLNFVITNPLGPSAPLTDVIVVATHNYQTAGPGSYNSSHQLNGQWTTAAGNAASLDTVLDVTAASPTTLLLLSGVNTAQTTTFNYGNPAIGATTSSAIFTIQTTLRLRLDGAGTIFLPSSADVDVEFVPAPSAAMMLGLTGLFAQRRRR